MSHNCTMASERPTDPDRGDRIRRVRTEFLGLKSQESFASVISKHGKTVTRGAVGNWELGKDVGLDSLTAIAKAAGVRLEWLAYADGDPFVAKPADADVVPAITIAAGGQVIGTPPTRPTPNASFPPIYQEINPHRKIPMLGQAEGGANGMFIMNGAKVDDVFCPPGLENVPEAYAVRVYGTSMEPRYVAGETVWLNPRLPVRAGDDVVMQLKPDYENGPMASFIKQFRLKNSRVVRLLQHNPEEGEPKELEFPADDVFSIHKIVHHSIV